MAAGLVKAYWLERERCGEYEAPTKEELSAISTRDEVQIAFSHDGYPEEPEELAWVKVDRVEKNKVVGRLKSRPMHILDWRYDDIIAFRKDRVIAIYRFH